LKSNPLNTLLKPFRSSQELQFVAFTTLNPDRSLYQRDALNAICFPRDWLLSLSYRKTWIEEEIRSQAENPRSLRGKLVLIVLCGNKGTDDAFDLYLPLRYGRVESADLRPLHELDGKPIPSDTSFLILNLRLEGRPTKLQLESFAENAKDLCTVPVNPNRGYYLVGVKGKKNARAVINPDGADELEWYGQVHQLLGLYPSLKARPDGGQQSQPRRYATLDAIRLVERRGHTTAKIHRRYPGLPATVVSLQSGRTLRCSSLRSR